MWPHEPRPQPDPDNEARQGLVTLALLGVIVLLLAMIGLVLIHW
jgi:hypothetical protein